MGVIFSAFIWSYALFQVPGGWLGDRFGPRKVLSVIMAYRTLIAGMTAAALGFKSLWGIRFLLGVGEAGAFPTATRAMQMWFPRDERGFVQGVSHAASRLGAAIGPPLAVAIMIHYGWRSVFYVIGVLSLMWSVLYLLAYRNMPEENERVSRAELARIRGVDEKGEIKKANIQKRPKVPWGVLLKHSNMWAVMCAYAAYIYSLWFFLSWLPSYLVEYRKYTLIKMGFFASMPLLAGVVGDTFGGWLTDKLLVKTNNLRFARRSVAIVAMLGCGASMLLAALAAKRDVLPRDDNRARVGGSDGHRRGILWHSVRHDEYGWTNRWGAVANNLRDSGGRRELGRALRRVLLPALRRGGHLGVLD
jgi:sugar phosphate permease